MYAVAKEHRNQLFVKTRRTVVLDKLDTLARKDVTTTAPPSPPTFHASLNDFCTISPPIVTQKRLNEVKLCNEQLTNAHRDMVNFINAGWRSVKQELDTSSKAVKQSSPVPAKQVTNIKLIQTQPVVPKNFVPFDLDSFWGQRIIQNLLQSS